MGKYTKARRLTADISVDLDPQMEVTTPEGGAYLLRKLFIRLERPERTWRTVEVAGSGAMPRRRAPDGSRLYRKSYYRVGGFVRTPEINAIVAKARSAVIADSRGN